MPDCPMCMGTREHRHETCGKYCADKIIRRQRDLIHQLLLRLATRGREKL